MQYRTSVPVAPPIALTGLVAPPPNVDKDVYAGLASTAAVNLDRQAQMANADYVSKARDAQTQMALKGIGQMASARQNAMDLANARRSAAMGYMNNILSGLFS